MRFIFRRFSRGFWVEVEWSVGSDLSFGLAGSATVKGSKLRYPLRSAGRGKLEPPAAADAPPSVSAPRRYPFSTILLAVPVPTF